jgi:hypothetical protein
MIARRRRRFLLGCLLLSGMWVLILLVVGFCGIGGGGGRAG